MLLAKFMWTGILKLLNELSDIFISNIIVFIKKPCHCNKFFRLKTRLTLLLNHYIPRCPFYCTYFAFRRTGSHPPLTNTTY